MSTLAPHAGSDHDAQKTEVRAAALLGVLGVVYGDIGTSPLYALKASLDHFGSGDVLLAADILGILSMIFWSLVLIVTVKYVSLVMRADNRGEGGILALMVLAQQCCQSPAADYPKHLHGLDSCGLACSFPYLHLLPIASRANLDCCNSNVPAPATPVDALGHRSMHAVYILASCCHSSC